MVSFVEVAVVRAQIVEIRKTDLKDPGSNLFLLNSLQNEEQHEGIENVGNF